MLLLSHPLSAQTPAYGGIGRPRITKDKQIAKGDSCNTLTLEFSNHAGTHFDCPYHFNETGKRLTDYPASFWKCEEVQLLSCTLSAGELCSNDHLEKTLQQSGNYNPDAGIVLLNTHWYKKRQESIFWQKPPGFLPELKNWLQEKFPKIRFFGFDVISLSSFANRDVGREAHREFLGENPILVIEDMNLAPLEGINKLGNVLISPLFIEEADGAPCSIWANL